MLNEEITKQIFFQSDRPREDALMADEVDILQFAENIAAFIAVECAQKEHARCVAIVRNMNSAVADALDSQRPK